jgi:putative membrane protein
VGVQAVLLAVLGVAIIKPSAGAALGATGVLLVAAVAFVSVNHALAAWGGNIGRLVSLFLLVVTTVAALAYSSPGAFAALKPLSPVTPALEALRSVMTGHSPVVPLLLLVGWTIVSVAASGAAVVRSRTVRLKDMAAAAPRV